MERCKGHQAYIKEVRCSRTVEHKAYRGRWRDKA